jgi:integrase
MHAYVVVSLLTGARTEELRALTWSHLDLEGDMSGMPPTPPSIQLWRSVRAGGETKTKRSRRTLELPTLCVDALREHRRRQLAQRIRMGEAVGGQRLGVRHPVWHRARRGECAPRVPDGRGCGWLGGDGVDAPASCSTVSSRCSPVRVCRSRTLRTSWVMPARVSLRRSIAKSFGRC